MKVVATMRRFGLAESEQERVWELWGEGTSLRAVAQARRQAGVRASVCDFDGRGETGSEKALEAMPV
jgi:hypothetical protein